MESLPSIVLAILAVGLLIIVHEAGHFLVARWSGMSVRRFSVGFGPPLVEFERMGTTFQIGAIPLGGFVQIDGLNPHDGTDPTAPGSYASKPFHLRFATILAGAAANYLLAFLGLWLYFAVFHQLAAPPLRIVRVLESSPAAEAGLEPGDLIVGTSSGAFSRVEELGKSLAASKTVAVALRVARGPERAESIVHVHPRPGPDGGRPVIGISFEPERYVDQPLGLLRGAGMAAERVVAISVESARVIASLLNPKTREHVELQGPPGIVQALSGTLQRSSAAALAQVAVISAALGWANLLPIPGLDGSRLMFLLLALIRRKQINPRTEAAVHTVGLMLLFALLVWVSIGDILK